MIGAVPGWGRPLIKALPFNGAVLLWRPNTKSVSSTHAELRSRLLITDLQPAQDAGTSLPNAN